MLKKNWDKALIKAVKQKDAANMRIALENGANPDVKINGQSAIIHVIKNTECIKVLIDAGANLDTPRTYHRNSLLYYFSNHDGQVFKKLVEAGADLNIKDCNLLKATVKNPEAFNLLLEHNIDLNRDDYRGNTALHYVAEQNSLEALKKLILKGADLNKKDNNNATALMIALKQKNFECAEALIDAGANLTLKNSQGSTALTEAIRRSAPLNIVNKMIERSSAQELNKIYLRTLIYAVKNDNLPIIKALIKAGADINARDTDGQGLAHFVRSTEVLEFLIHQGADIHRCDNDGETPFATAAGASFHSSNILKHFVAAGVDINTQDIYGHTPLMKSAMGGYDKRVQFLLEHDADTQKTDEDGKTVFALATGNKTKKVLQDFKSQKTESPHHFVSANTVTTITGTCPINGKLSLIFNFSSQTVTVGTEKGIGQMMSFEKFQETSRTAREEIETAFNWLKKHPKGCPKYPFKKVAPIPMGSSFNVSPKK